MRLTTNGVKGYDRSLDLARLNLIVAPNGRGKTTLNSALKFLLLGHDPALGKVASKTAALMSDGQLDVTLELDEKRVIKRGLRRSGSTLKGSAECSWLRAASPDEHAKAILSLAGREEPEAIQNLHCRELLDLPPAQKATVMESILSAGKKTPRELALLTARLTVQRLTKLDKELTGANYKNALALLKEEEQAALKMLAPMLEGKLGETGIPGAVTWANAEKRRAASDLEGKEKAKVELETRLGDSTDVPQSEIDALEAEKEQLQREIGAAEEREREARRRAQALQVANQELDFAATRLESAKAEWASAPDGFPDPNDLENQAQMKLDTLNELKLELVPSPKYAEMKVADLKNEIEQATASPWGEVKEIGLKLRRFRDDDIQSHGTRLIQLSKAALRNVDPDQLQRDLESAEAELLKVALECQEVTDRNFDITQKRVKFKADADDLRRRAGEARKAEREGERIKRALDSATESYEAAKRRHEELTKDQPAQEPIEYVNANALGEIKAKLDTLYRTQATRQQLADIITEINDLSALKRVFTELEWALQRVRESELNESGGPLMAHIEKFLKAAGRKETPYFTASRTDFEIGWTDEKGRKVAIQVMSGAEFALFSAAFHAAIIALRNPPLKVLIVEAGEATKGMCAWLMAGIEAVCDTLDLALVLTPHEPDASEINPGWKVTRLA